MSLGNRFFQKNMMRLDKFFTECGLLSRSQVKKEIKKNLIYVNGELAKSSDMKIDPELDQVVYHNKVVTYEEFVYYVMNKPAGIVSAVTDDRDKTVIDLVKEFYPQEKRDIFPVGRLDKDTEGLLLITNDGQLSHELLSPTKHVAKTYYVEFELVKEGITCEDIRQIELGLDIGEERLTKPASLEILELNQEKGRANLTIVEGKFHQVKRMFDAVGCHVTYLKRISFGILTLDQFPNFSIGQVIKIDRATIEGRTE